MQLLNETAVVGSAPKDLMVKPGETKDLAHLKFKPAE
jgi:hypothetical protein